MKWRALLLAAVVQFYPVAHAVTGIHDDCEHELSVQVDGMKRRVESNGFITGRDLLDYEDLLGAPGLPSVAKSLRALPPGSVWMDLGAGEAWAQRKFLYGYDGDLGTVAVSYNAPEKSAGLTEDLKLYEGRFHYVESGFLEEAMADRAHPIQRWRGKVSFLTEVWGPSAYVRDLNLAFENIADLLAVGGQARILMGIQTLYFRDGKQLEPAEIAAAICKATGGRLRVVEAKNRTTAHWVGVFEKVSDIARPAPRFKLTEFWNDGPPRRVYEVP